MVESGNKALLKLFDKESISSNDEAEYYSKDCYKEITECLNSVNDISSWPFCGIIMNEGSVVLDDPEGGGVVQHK